MNLIGLTGHKGSGKDTAAAALMPLGYTNLKFATPLKEMTRALFRSLGIPLEQIDRMVEGDMKECRSVRLPGHTPRYVMQTLGTEWGRDCMGEDFWVNVARARAAYHPGRRLFSDVRFRNEAQMIRDLGGVIIKIERPGLDIDLSHPSEQEIALIEPDVVFDNETRTPEQFQVLIRDWVEAELRVQNHS